MASASQTLEVYNKKKASMGAGEETAAKKLARERSAALIAKATQKTQETVVKSLAALKLSLTNSLDSISNQLSSEISTLKDIQEAITVEKENLKNLHGIVAEADSLQALIAAQREQSDVFQAEIARDRAVWEERKKLDEKVHAEALKEQAKKRKWDEEQYAYDLAKQRKLEQDDILAAREAAQKVIDDQNAQRDEALVAREKAMFEKENEVVKLREMVGKSEEATRKEVAKEVAIATSSLKKDLTHTHELAKLGLENQLGLKSSEITTLTNRVAELLKANADLATQSKDSSDKVQKIAEKAIEGAQKQVVYQQPSGSEPTSTTSRRS